ncbi:hypothetical protein RFUL19S_02126 [Rhizobacter fulvus]|jgi:hypothetical protein
MGIDLMGKFAASRQAAAERAFAAPTNAQP